jgi:peroxiredoxin
MNKMLKVALVMLSASVLVIAGCSPVSTPQAVDGGEGEATYPLAVNLSGEESEFLVDSQGVLKSKIEISSADGGISLSIDEGTVLLSQDGEPLGTIDVVIAPSPPPAQDAYIMGTAYDLGPQGATFTPQLWLTLSYDPEELPAGVRENDLYIAYYDGAEWQRLPYKRVDANAHSVTTQIYHFTTLAILAAKEPTPSTTPAPPQGTQVGNLAPDFQLLALDQQPVSLGDLRGKPVVLNFWASWCRPCVFEMPFLQEIHEEYSGSGLVLLAINIGESPTTVEKFLQRNNLSLPVLLDTSRVVAQKYRIQYRPTTFFIDGDGVIQEKRIGPFINAAQIQEQLSKIMP